MPDAIRALCEGADLLLHAQYRDEEFEAKPGWGHSTVGYAVRVAAESSVRQLLLFHHARRIPTVRSPHCYERRESRGLEEVTVAREGTTVSV